MSEAERVFKVPLDAPWYVAWILPLVEYAAVNPWEFLQYTIMCLSPFLCLSGILSWKLAKQLEREEKLRKAHAKRTNAIKQRKIK
ncbi:small integral membrane protein 15 [Galendromus occidentalis]|uniref:Small integral membrane protein 15 n=1 Tax=Galendromus occidentalis TaxID=34638 RepID=A0AAJ6VYS0_9ACAR|nr:small integral membrane protein 15 [Galendromus occidentalis]